MTNSTTNNATLKNSTPHYLKDLNPQQYKAARHTNGPLLIFAGAGSGKTRVLTRRIAHLLLEESVHPKEILAVTFTNKAAREMKERIGRLFPQDRVSLWVSTFHSCCVRILRQHGSCLGYTSNFAIYDRDNSLSVIKRVSKRLNIDPKVMPPQGALAQIDRAKNSYQDPDTFREQMLTHDSWNEYIVDIYTAYQEELLEANAMDFGDLLCNTVSLFKLETDLLNMYQRKLRHIMVDEYQDTNYVQYLLIKMLADHHKNLCVVGDDDQSIYAFRGATIENILNFQKDYPDAEIVTLDVNYRSTKNILEAANAVIARNKNRQEKAMRTDNPHGGPIVCYRAHDERDEAQFVSREIVALRSSAIPAREIAIFYRTNAQSRAIEEALCELGLPYDIYGGLRFYDRKEVKDILAYFRLLLNPKDNESFLRVVNTPNRGLGSGAVGSIIAYAEKNRSSLLEAMRNGIESGELSGAAAKKGLVFINLIDELSEAAHTAEQLLEGAHGNAGVGDSVDAIANLLKIIAEKSGYLQRLKKQNTEEAQSRIENIFELCNVALEFTRNSFEQQDSVSLNEFLDRTSLVSDLDQENTKKSDGTLSEGAISLMTLHLAKGLEFEAAFLVGMEDGLLPHIRSLDSRAAIEEERRLCYVGITRAKSRLYISRAMQRDSFGRSTWYSGVPSRFLGDIPPELVEERQSEFREEQAHTTLADE